MKNEKDIKITTYGSADINTLFDYEQNTFYTNLLNHIQELYKQSK